LNDITFFPVGKLYGLLFCERFDNVHGKPIWGLVLYQTKVGRKLAVKAHLKQGRHSLQTFEISLKELGETACLLPMIPKYVQSDKRVPKKAFPLVEYPKIGKMEWRS
jgi:hypothetical protein